MLIIIVNLLLLHINKKLKFGVSAITLYKIFDDSKYTNTKYN